MSAGEVSSVTGVARPRVSTRDRDALGRGLERWLAGRRGALVPRVLTLSTPEGTGMSSDTLLFEVAWSDGEHERLVARLAPSADAVPVFPRYDLECQYRTMEAARDHSPVPVPPLRGYEPDPVHLGTPFLVMGRVDGRVPPDIPPYTFGAGWVADASDADRERLERGAVSVLAGIHGIRDAPAVCPWLVPSGEATPLDHLGAPTEPGEHSALRAHVDAQRAYAEWVLDGRPGPLIERGFAWLEEHWPAHEGDTVLSWGDARIGNVMFDDCTPVAVLDWEMATLGPRELDIGWMIFLHRFFDDLARQLDLPGLPDFLRRSEVARVYAELTGHTPGDLDWYTAYAAVRHAIIMTRIGMRQVRFGEAALPDDLDDLVTHRASLEAMLSGTYWDSVPT
ncbi:MAG: putative phosphotransferase [Acidimicrobiia bacterium]